MTTTETKRGIWWPLASAPREYSGKGSWALWMSGGGSIVIWPADQAPPEELKLIRFYRTTKEKAERFLITFCSLGYETDARHEHQDGEIRIFNWRSYSYAQVGIASQVAHHFVNGRYNEAWAVGHAFRDQIQAAENAEGRAAWER